jgi:hypothetical protein
MKWSAFDGVKLKQGPGYDKREAENLPLVRTLKDTCFRTKLIEELDVLCRLAVKYKGIK